MQPLNFNKKNRWSRYFLIVLIAGFVVLSGTQAARAETLFGVVLKDSDSVLRVKRFGVGPKKDNAGNFILKHGLEYRVNLNSSGGRVSSDLSNILRRHKFKTLKEFKNWLNSQPQLVSGYPHKRVGDDLGRRLFDLVQKYDENRLGSPFDD